MQKEVITRSVATRTLKIFNRERENDGEDIACMQQAMKETLGSLTKYKGYHRPVCAACQVEMHPERNGVGVLDMADYGPVNLWDADLWECPKCHFQIVSGFGDSPVARHNEGDRFERLVKSYNENSIVIESR